MANKLEFFSKKEKELLIKWTKALKKYKENPELPCNHSNEIDAQAYAVVHRVFPIEKIGYY